MGPIMEEMRCAMALKSTKWPAEPPHTNRATRVLGAGNHPREKQHFGAFGRARSDRIRHTAAFWLRGLIPCRLSADWVIRRARLRRTQRAARCALRALTPSLRTITSM
jgi:hypothetical protein